MRFKSIKLINYIGIYNGMGIKEIYIDFTKCRHNTVIIIGDNGSGKSTLFNALNPLPDSNDQFIPGATASKEIELIDNGVEYYIKFIHNVNQHGTRETTKAYIYKNIGGVPVDMNPNGNVSSFKDILYDEFKLDSNFVALSQLSTEDKGLADKKPAERKKFVNAIIETLSTYNNIHKTLTKRSSTFKSIINSITSKLDSIGDRNHLDMTLLSLDNRVNLLEASKKRCIEERASSKSIIAMIDQEGTLKQRYEDLKKELTSSISEYNSLATNIRNTLIKFGIEPSSDVLQLLEESRVLKESLGTEIQIKRNTISSLLADREEDSRKLQAKVERLKALDSQFNQSELKKAIKSCKDKISECDKIFSSIGIENAMNLSKDEYIIGLNTLKEIKEIIDIFKSEMDYVIIEEALNVYLGTNKYPDIELTRAQRLSEEDRLQSLQQELYEWHSIKNVSLKLNMRPTKCKINECEFISDALSAFDKDPDGHIDSINKQISECKFNIIECIRLNDAQNKLIDCINYMKTIIRSIDNHKNILSKLPNGDLYTDSIQFFRVFLSGQSFDYINTLYSYISYANIFEEYKAAKNTLSELENEMRLYNSKNDILEEISIDVNELNNALTILTDRIEKEQEELKVLMNKQLKASNMETSLSTMISMAEKHSELGKFISEMEITVSNMESDIEKLNNCYITIEAMDREETRINSDLFSIIQDRDKIKHAIKMSEEYKVELADFQARYNLVEKIKYYSSPTTGIQLIFMELYMSKIISLANDLLSLLFEGRFVIQPFIINDTEFKIPCIGNGLPNDDISSLSTGERSMISMIISFSLLYQSSTRYNILKLDEIDAPLDKANRLQFILVLEKLIEILESEQCIMISHNSELDTSNVDIIILKNTSATDRELGGNIIYKF